MVDTASTARYPMLVADRQLQDREDDEADGRVPRACNGEPERSAQQNGHRRPTSRPCSGVADLFPQRHWVMECRRRRPPPMSAHPRSIGRQGIRPARCHRTSTWSPSSSITCLASSRSSIRSPPLSIVPDQESRSL